ncbi:MAG: hypothetical protein HQL76_08135 [Magnetococcales bacterium]|nr:hypothetical protein [Magnetococcales bacterium]
MKQTFKAMALAASIGAGLLLAGTSAQAWWGPWNMPWDDDGPWGGGPWGGGPWGGGPWGGYPGYYGGYPGYYGGYPGYYGGYPGYWGGGYPGYWGGGPGYWGGPGTWRGGTAPTESTSGADSQETSDGARNQ